MAAFQGKLRIRHLEIVLKVSECGSLSKAATQLHMTQSGLSRAIAEIEEVVGGRLFERTGKGMVRTPVGTALCRHAHVLLGDFAAAESELAAISRGDLGSMTVGCFSMFSGWPLAEAVRTFRVAYPRIALTIQIGTHERLVEDLDSAKLDVLISRNLSSPNPEIYNTVSLLSDSVVLACSVDSPLARKASVDLSECVQLPWITALPKSRVRAELETCLREQGHAIPDIVGALSLEFAMEMLSGADYLCMLPESVAAVLQARGALHVLPVVLNLQRRPLAAIWRRDRSSTHHVRAFACILGRVINAKGAVVDA